MSQSEASSVRVDAALRREAALKLRRDGKTYREIADELGCGKATASRLVRNALRWLNDRCAEEVAELRRLVEARLDAALAALMPAVEVGCVKAIRALIALEARRCALRGLDAPTRVAVEDVSMDEAAAREYLESLGVGTDERTNVGDGAPVDGGRAGACGGG